MADMTTAMVLTTGLAAGSAWLGRRLARDPVAAFAWLAVSHILVPGLARAAWRRMTGQPGP